MKQSPNIHMGPPAWGPDFFDREEIIQECWNTLESASFILSAPRRYGKSSVMLSLRDNPQDEFFPIYFELEEHSSLQGFIYEFVSKIVENDNSIMKTFKRWLSKVFQGIEELSVLEVKIKIKKAIEKDEDWEAWKERIKQFMMDLLKNKKNKKLLFILDEFPMMLSNFINEGEKGEKEALKVLHWLRKLRHESPFLENARFILGGSIGIEKVLSYLKATRTINDVQKIVIGPFEHHVAEDFIRMLFKVNGISVDDKVIKAIMDIVGTMIPIYLQIMVDSIIKESMTTGSKIVPDLVKYCYENRVHGTDYKQYFEDYYDRLCRYYRTEEKLKSAEQMLKELANADDGISYDNLFYIYQERMGKKGNVEKFELLLSALESDFYIERDEAEKKVYFHNKWLKDWWRIHHGV